MKICMVTSAEFPPKEGIGNYVTSLSKELLTKGHEVVIVTRGTAKRCREQTIEGLSVFQVPYLPLYPLHADIHGAFTKSLIDSRFSDSDIFHYHSPLVKYSGNKTPTITTVHTPMAFDVPRIEISDARSLGAKFVLSTASARIERTLFDSSTVLATVSTQVSKDLTSMNLKCGKVLYIGNGVDHQLFQPGSIERDNNSVLCVGRVSYRKGHIDLIDAAGIVTDSLPDTTFNIVGDGPLLPKLRKYVHTKGLDRNFKFRGRVSRDSLIRLYQTCGVFVLPSHYEGMATVLLEAMSCGAPVISTTVGGSTDLIDTSKNGILVPIADPKLLASAIRQLLEEPAIRGKIAAQSRSTILGRFTWSEIARRYENTYVEALAERG